MLFAGGEVNLYRYVLNNPINFVDPEGRAPKDKTFGLPKRFWNWYHKQVKRKGDPDISRDEALDLFEEWLEKGKPGPDGKSNKFTGGGTTFDRWCSKYPSDCVDLLRELGGGGNGKCK